ncbi:DUF4265 domain-containing protein [Massilia scottii]|uniref:DUF4265 domain-containing protein n=1 Tax=Massilia scottii TaxID=3057166 RepID=UPI002796C53D|nr:DUF4265 domain-containing protein [Massilia sp. CCM 9029]MDQ1835503.1 DUF4265 domain-containing protein [Massilia sp. CCM 9029]
MIASKDGLPIELHFRLNVVDEWPPVAVEGVLCTAVDKGYRIESPPLFVKGISVGDIIEVAFDLENDVASWQPISQSGRTTAWILRTGSGNNIATVLPELRALGCQIVELPELGCYAVDIPPEVSIADIDACLARLDGNSTAVAFPSYRHP